MTERLPGASLAFEILTGARAGERVVVPLPCTVGRSPEAALALPDPHLSTQHGVVERRDGALFFVDRGSSNGSVHQRGDRSTPLREDCLEVELWDGDHLHLGDPTTAVTLRVNLPEAGVPAVVAERPIAQVERFADRVTAEPGRLSLLYRLSVELGATTDLDAVLQVAATTIFDLLPRATHLAVVLEERGGSFRLCDRRGGGHGRRRSGGSGACPRRASCGRHRLRHRDPARL